LHGELNVDEAVADFGADGFVAGETSELGGLERPADAVVVGGVALLDAGFAGVHPREVVAEPGLDGGVVGGRKEELEEGGGASYFYEVERVDDAIGAAGGASVADALGELEAGVHARGGRDEPGEEMRGGGAGVVLFVGEDVGGGEGRHRQAEADHGAAVILEVVGVGFAVDLFVGA